MKPEDIDSAIQHAIDGEIGRSECERLRAVLKADPAARQVFYEYVGLHQGLKYWLGHEHYGDSSHRMVDGGPRLRVRRHEPATFAMAAAVLLGIGMVFTFWVSRGSGPSATFRCAPGSLCRVTRSGSETSAQQGDLDAHSRVELTQGVAEVTMRDGSRAVVLAPATFGIADKHQMSLDRGRAWVRVSPKGHGFEVRTPELMVTDLGTEFGVAAGLDSGDEVHVFSGRVMAGDRRALQARETLTSGQARASDSAGRMRAISVRHDEFLTTLPAGSRSGLVANGDFEAGTPPADGCFGQHASPALLPFWSFGSSVSIALKDDTGRSGYGEHGSTVVSPTHDVQVAFQDDTNGRPSPANVTLRQSFATVSGSRYVVGFAMGGYFSMPNPVELTVSVFDGMAPSQGGLLAETVDRRTPAQGTGYNVPRRFEFTAKSSMTTLVVMETSPNTDDADPVIDNLSIAPVE